MKSMINDKIINCESIHYICNLLIIYITYWSILVCILVRPLIVLKISLKSISFCTWNLIIPCAILRFSRVSKTGPRTLVKLGCVMYTLVLMILCHTQFWMSYRSFLKRTFKCLLLCPANISGVSVQKQNLQ